MSPLPERADKAQTAAWMGYPPGLTGIAAMDALHDPLHAFLAASLGLPSLSLRIASGEALSGPERILAGLEEDAVLVVQRWVQHMRAAGFEPSTQIEVKPPLAPEGR